MLERLGVSVGKPVIVNVTLATWEEPCPVVTVIVAV
jgi:hypothetical protein